MGKSAAPSRTHRFALIAIILLILFFGGTVVLRLGNKYIKQPNSPNTASEEADSDTDTTSEAASDTDTDSDTDGSKKPVYPAPKGNREVGNAGEFYPYGIMDESTYREFAIDGLGGSMPATLSANITMYLVYPSGLGSGQMMSFTPYYSMPTAKDSMPLSNELGYGVDIRSANSRHGELPSTMYLVFDLDNGETIKKIRHTPSISYFCDPGQGSFDPFACALLNNVPLSEHTNEKYAVVSPIRTERLTYLTNMTATIPIGFDNLIVAEISNEGTYIPQKLTKELLADLIKANGISSATTIYRIEGATRAIKNGIYPGEDIKNIGSGLYGVTADEDIKILHELPKIQALLKKLKSGKDLTKEEQRWAGLINETYVLGEGIQEQAIKDLKLEINSLTHDRNQSSRMISGAALIARLEKAKMMDFTKEKEELHTFLKDEIEYFKEEEDTAFITNMFLAEAFLYMSDQPLSLNIPAIFNLVREAHAERRGVVDGPPEWFEEVNKIIDKICANPDSTSRQIRNAMEVAGRTGEMGRLEGCKNKMCDRLKKDLASAVQSPIQVAADWGLYQGSCEDDDNRDEEYKKKVMESYTVLECNTLIEKNLITFAWNEFKCREVLKKDDAQAKKEGYESAKQKLRDAANRH